MTTTQGSDIPWFAYILATVAGLCFIVVASLLSFFGADSLSGFIHDRVTVFAIIFAIIYAMLGAAFGFIWPEKTWRWGLLVSLAPVTLLSFFGLAVFHYSLIVLIPACAGAYMTARLHLNYVATD